MVEIDYWTMVYVIAISTVYFFFFDGYQAWNKVRRLGYYGWVIFEILSCFHFSDYWRWGWWIAAGIALFIFLFANDDWRNKRKRQFNSAKLRAKRYLAYGIEARRPMPA